MSDRGAGAGAANALGASDLRFLNILLALLGGENEGVARGLHGVDVERFRRWCLRQQLGGYAYLLLEEMSLAVAMPRDLVSGLRGAYLEQWARSERLRLGLAELAALLRGEGESFLVLKGLPFAQRYYGSHDRRATGDLDVWVPRDRAPAVAELLERRGFERSSPRYDADSPTLDHVHQVELEFHGIGVELHHALRVHRTFRIDEQRLWTNRARVAVQGVEYEVPSHEHALLLHLLGLHTDIQIGQTNARWFADVFRMLLEVEGALWWDEFFAARDDDGTRKICVNSLALFLVLTRSDERFPSLAAALDQRRADIVLDPDRLAYLDLLRGASMLERKLWPLRQYEEGTAAAVSWWMAGMPRRIAAKPDAFARDVSTRPEGSVPWETSELESTRSELENEFGVDPATFQETFLRFGSLGVQVRYQTADHLEAVEELFRLRPRQVGETSPPAPGGASVDLVLHVFHRDREQLALLRVPSQPVVRRPLERLLEIHDGIAHLWLREPKQREDDGRRSAPRQGFLAIDRAAETRPLLLHSLMVVLNKLLSLDDRYHLHAAAAAVGGATSLFVGAKGSGKSTITLVLGKAGATLFSEDHVMLRRAGDRFLVSGCDGKMHLTEASERHFFDRPLDGRWIESAGVAKKQIDMATIFDCRPYVETEVRNLFFPRVGERFEIRALAKEEAAARLLEPVLERHRFVDDAEQEAFLDLFARLVESCATWEVDLSRDLRELDRLVEFLAARATAVSLNAPQST